MTRRSTTSMVLALAMAVALAGGCGGSADSALPEEAIVLADGEGNPRMARMSVDDSGNVHLVWVEDGGLMARTRTPGREWSDATKLTDGDDASIEPYLLRHPEGKACVVWDGFRAPGDKGLSMRCWEGSTWAERQDLHNAGLTTRFRPAFTPTGEVEAAYWTAPGSAFFGDGPIYDWNTIEAHSQDTVAEMAFAIDTYGRFHAVVEVNNPYRIVHRMSEDGGQTWSKEEQVADESSVFLSEPQLVPGNDGDVHLMWTFRHVYYRHWVDGAWEEQVDVSGERSEVAEPSLTVDSGGRAHIAWGEQNGVALVDQAEDGSWSDAQEISSDVPAASAVTTADAGGAHFVAWITEEETPVLKFASLPR